MASISSGCAAQQRKHQTARQRTASAPLVMRQSLGGAVTSQYAAPSRPSGHLLRPAAARHRSRLRSRLLPPMGRSLRGAYSHVTVRGVLSGIPASSAALGLHHAAISRGHREHRLTCRCSRPALGCQSAELAAERRSLGAGECLLCQQSTVRYGSRIQLMDATH